MSWLNNNFTLSGKSSSGNFLSLISAGMKFLSQLSEKKESKS